MWEGARATLKIVLMKSNWQNLIKWGITFNALGYLLKFWFVLKETGIASMFPLLYGNVRRTNSDPFWRGKWRQRYKAKNLLSVKTDLTLNELFAKEWGFCSLY